jgi:hypothetical protein
MGRAFEHRIELPAGTRIHPEECGFALPDGRYLRVYAYGVREERPDGSAVSGEPHVGRPQLFAHRCRVGGNTHAMGPTTWVAYETATDVSVTLPDALGEMDDEELIALAHLIMRRVVELEFQIDVDEGDLLVELAEAEEGERVFHVLDLSAAGRS